MLLVIIAVPGAILRELLDGFVVREHIAMNAAQQGDGNFQYRNEKVIRGLANGTISHQCRHGSTEERGVQKAGMNCAIEHKLPSSAEEGSLCFSVRHVLKWQTPCTSVIVNRWISISAALIIAIALATLLIIGPKTGNVENLRATLLGYGPWAIVISIGLMVGQAIIAPLPMNVITITNALVFGPVWGSVLSWFSTVLGACLCFLLSKTFGKPFAQKIVGDSIHRAEGFFTKYGLHAMFLVRMMPGVPFDAVSYGAPLVGVPFSRFLLATALGIIPSVLVYSYLGRFIAGIYWWVLIGLLSVSLVGVVIAALALRRRASTDSPFPPFASSEKISDPIS